MAQQGNRGNILYLGINGQGLLNTKATKEQYESVDNLGDSKATPPISARKLHGDFIKIENTHGVFYQKVFRGGTDLGVIDYLEIKTKNYKTGPSEELTISVKHDNGIDSISVPLKNKGNLGDYAKNLACLLPNVDFSKKYVLKPSTKRKNDWLVRNIYINDESGEMVTLAHKYGDDIPAREAEEKLGKTVYDSTKQDEYLFNILKDQIERFNTEKEARGPVGTASKVTAETAETAETSSAPEVGIVEEDIPF